MAQPLPKPGREPVMEAAIQDIVGTIRSQQERGLRKYGSELMTFNGRDAGQDGWEELADLIMYFKQVRMERSSLENEVVVLRARVRLLESELGYKTEAVVGAGGGGVLGQMKPGAPRSHQEDCDGGSNG